MFGKQKKIKTKHFEINRRVNHFGSRSAMMFHLSGIEKRDSSKNIMIYIPEKVTNELYIKDVTLMAKISSNSYMDSVTFGIVLSINNTVDTIIDLPLSQFEYKKGKLLLDFNNYITLNKKYDGFYFYIKGDTKDFYSFEHSGITLYLTNNKKYKQLTHYLKNNEIKERRLHDIYKDYKLPESLKVDDNYNLICEINYLAN